MPCLQLITCLIIFVTYIYVEISPNHTISSADKGFDMALKDQLKRIASLPLILHSKAKNRLRIRAFESKLDTLSIGQSRRDYFFHMKHCRPWKQRFHAFSASATNEPPAIPAKRTKKIPPKFWNVDNICLISTPSIFFTTPPNWGWLERGHSSPIYDEYQTQIVPYHDNFQNTHNLLVWSR